MDGTVGVPHLNFPPFLHLFINFLCADDEKSPLVHRWVGQSLRGDSWVSSSADWSAKFPLGEEEVLRVSAPVKCSINQNQSFGPLPSSHPSPTHHPLYPPPLGLLQLIIIWQQGLFCFFLWSDGASGFDLLHSQWTVKEIISSFLLPLEASNTHNHLLVEERLLVKWGDKLRWIGLWSETFPIYSIEKLNLKDWLNTSP